MIYFYSQIDWISSYAKGKHWQWADSRPDMLAGFVPTGGFMNIVGFLAIYMATYRKVHGAGAKIKFPGNKKAWDTRFTDCNQILLGRFNVWLSTSEKQINGEAYNVASGNITSWAHTFPQTAKWFGLEAVAPEGEEDGGEEAFNWWQQTGASAYSDMVKAEGLKERDLGPGQWGFLRACTGYFSLDRYLDLSKVRELGWNETEDSAKGYLDALDQYAAFRVIPKFT